MNSILANGTLVRCVVTAAIPTLALVGSHFFAGAPTSATAAPTRSAESLPDVTRFIEPTVATEAGSRAEPVLPDGVFHIARNVADTVAEVLPPVDNGKPTLPPMTLSSVLPSASRGVAVIDGRPVRVGDSPAPGWCILEIDGQSRSVVLVHASGERARLTMATGSD